MLRLSNGTWHLHEVTAGNNLPSDYSVWHGSYSLSDNSIKFSSLV